MNSSNVLALRVPEPWRIAAVAIAIFAILCLQALPSGLASFSFDSFRYLAGAESILQTGTYHDISGGPQRFWPPGTSLVYAAAAYLSNTPPDQLVSTINFGALLLTAISFWRILQASIERHYITIIAFTAFMLNTGLLSMHNKLWSDPLALSTNTAAIACAITAVRSVEKNWYGWLSAACVLLSLAICIRFAMIATVPVLACVAVWLSWTTRSHRHAILVPLLTPLPMIILFRLLGVSGASDRVSGFRSPDIWQLWQTFSELADQLLPLRLFPTGSVPAIILILTVAVPIGLVVFEPNARKRPALVISIGFTITYCVFLVFAQMVAVPSFDIVFKTLFPIYPFLLISLATAVEVLLTVKWDIRRVLGLVMLAVLAIGAARSVRASAMLYGNQSHAENTCMSRENLSAAIKGTDITPNPPKIISNLQGLVWYVLRRPVEPLLPGILEEMRHRSLVLYFKSKQLCSDTNEWMEIDETELLSAQQITVLSTNDLLLLARITPRPHTGLNYADLP